MLHKVINIQTCILCSRQDDLTTNLRTDQNTLGTVNQSLLNVPRTPGDVPQVRIACPSPKMTSIDVDEHNVTAGT